MEKKMDKCKFHIEKIRFHLEKENTLLITGWYPQDNLQGKKIQIGRASCRERV